MSHQIRILDINDRSSVAGCFQVFKILRPHLDAEEFTRRVTVQTRESYQVAYIDVGGEIVAAAGYRVANFLAWGKVLYVDDLITHPDRKRIGLGGTLMDWIVHQGQQLDCDAIHLDTGFTRHDAHRLYLNKGFVLDCHHLARKLK
jgi:GNAT superfamily N-acetyltransferase